MSRPALALLLLPLALGNAACGKKSPGTQDAPPPRPDAALYEEAGDVRPVYPVDDQPPDLLAERFCRAVYLLPAERRAACCGGEAAPTLASECARTLSYALRSKAVTVDEKAVAACEAGQARAHEGCDWVGPLGASLPPACAGLLHGTLAAGTRCRSSLECQDGLRCRGVGPTDPGTCGPPLVEGARCNVAVDTLVTYARQEVWTEAAHRECQGYCSRRACRAAVPEGGACTVSGECGAGHRCLGKHCVAGGLAQAGEECSADECAPGLRCSQNRCLAPKPAGQPCKTPFECAGGCVNGKCATQCSVGLPAPARPKKD
jgi:hypothetical protein